jgi:hypothetical protein
MRLHTKIILSIFVFCMATIYSKNPFISNKLDLTSSNFYSVYIMDKGKCNTDELANMLIFYNPEIDQEYANQISSIYYEESDEENVNHDIAFCQMLLETGFLNFGGTVLEEQNNFCGLGAINEKVRGLYFPDMRTGVRAHIQHLKAYASQDDLNNECVDDRFKYVKRGSATNIFDLKGKWAADPDYDRKLENLLIRLFWLRKLNSAEALSYSSSK